MTGHVRTSLQVEYVGSVSTCPACHNPGHTTKTDGLVDFYMNGDWMEYRAQAEEMADSGPPMSSYHYIWDVELLSQAAAILGKVADAHAYTAQAANLRQLYNAVYLRQGRQNASTCGYQPETGHHSKGGGGLPIRLACPGSTIAKVTFADFGMPVGSCASGFKTGSCSAKSSWSVVKGLCVNRSACVIVPSVDQFGGDPCEGFPKHLAVEIACTAPPVPGPGKDMATYGAGQTINAVPLSYGLSPANMTELVMEALLQNIVAAGNHSTVGFIGGKYLYPTLTKHDHGELALDLALQTTMPSYGFQVILPFHLSITASYLLLGDAYSTRTPSVPFVCLLLIGCLENNLFHDSHTP